MIHAGMRRFANRTIVLRVDEAALDADGATVVGDLTFLAEHGVHPIVVAPTRAVARSYVRTMNRTANAAVGLSGRDGAMLPAGGLRGIGSVQTGILRTLLAAGYLPVIEPTALGIAGDDVDVAADDVAAAVAAATEAARAIFFHAAGGVVDPQTAALIDELTPAEALALAERADLDAALRAAVRAAALGVRAGVGAAQIVDGRIAHAVVIEFLTAQHLGTQVTGGVYVGGS
jgi:acetylglutamate kinase